MLLTAEPLLTLWLYSQLIIFLSNAQKIALTASFLFVLFFTWFKCKLSFNKRVQLLHTRGLFEQQHGLKVRNRFWYSFILCDVQRNSGEFQCICVLTQYIQIHIKHVSDREQDRNSEKNVNFVFNTAYEATIWCLGET